MTGAALAVLAALAYGLAGVLIMRGKAGARGDNGVFLSVLLTMLLSGLLWLGSGGAALSGLATPDALKALGVFALAGVMANGLGRHSMYRATELVGAVRAGLLRRLTPLFALPFAFLILGEWPGPAALLGGALVVLGVLFYLRAPAAPWSAGRGVWAGLLLGLLSPLAYALAYSFRGLGLETVPDAALGACIGAAAGALWGLAAAMLGKGPRAGWHHVTIDRGPRHLQAACALSAGQLLQFFALKEATVLTVSVLGTLEVLFSALFAWVLLGGESPVNARLLIATLIAMAGTVLLIG